MCRNARNGVTVDFGLSGAECGEEIKREIIQSGQKNIKPSVKRREETEAKGKGRVPSAAPLPVGGERTPTTLRPPDSISQTPLALGGGSSRAVCLACLGGDAAEGERSWVSGGRPASQPAAMAILFAVVARGSTILAKHAWCGGNFLEVTEQILAKTPSENNKLTYSHGNYLFHYICEDRIIYLCITDDNFERSRAFTFLNEIKKRFQNTYGSRAQTALPYAMNSEFSTVLAAQLKYHSETKGNEQVAETQAQVDELKGIMVRNIDLVAQRGEKLELLIDKTENLVDSSVTFKTTSRNLARAMCMKNLKLTIIIAIVTIVIIYIIVSAACGGLSWPNCVPK